MNHLMRSVSASLVVATLFFWGTHPSVAESFPLPENSDSVVGELRYTEVRRGETLVDIAREVNLGYDQIILANPTLNRWIPDERAKVVVPHQYVLPGTTRRGLVLNIAELRLYFYPPITNGQPRYVVTHPVSIGRMDWRTPLGQTSVVKKERDPTWRPPPSIRREHELDGDHLPDFIAGGAPDNPLGRFALRLGFPSYLIHGVDERKAYGIGMRVTHGCIRMYPEDIESLFPQVQVGTPVLIVNEQVKIGQRDGRIFLEVHQPLEENEDEAAPVAPRIPAADVVQFVRRRLGEMLDLDYSLIAEIAERGDGIPTEIAQTEIYGTATQYPIRDNGIPQATKSVLDDEYQRAVAKYLEEADEPTATPTPRPREHQRRPPSSSRANIVDLQSYLEEHY
jgi:L,D-transpeptidase ErfK/SrfK